MLKKLKRTFLLTSTALTSLVLLAACLFAYYFSKNQLQSAYRETLEYQSQTLSVLLANTDRLDHEEIYRMELESGLLIYLFDNGSPVEIVSTQPGIQREALLAHTMDSIANSGVEAPVSPGTRSAEPINTAVEFRQDGEGYLAKFISVPTGPRTWYSLLLVKPTAGQDREIARLRSLYAVVFLGGVLLLLLASWWLAGRSVRPARDAQEKQKEFIAAASHELKSPLAVISSSVDVLLEERQTAPEGLHKIKKETHRMAGLVEDLLLLSGADTGRWTIQASLCNAEDSIADTYERFLPIAASNKQTLSIHLPAESMPEIYADTVRLQQILDILVSNALSYSAPGKTVELAGKVNKDTILISVIDQGPGIPDSDKENVFESFYRGDKSHKDKGHFGLGLAVAKQLVELHDGSISVADTPGGGATFKVQLPIASKKHTK